MDRLDAMQVFVRVAELGSFSAVAAQLDVARSVVTRQVAALEKRLGVKLIARTTRRLGLTAEGAGYLEKCREILNLVEASESALDGERATPRGHIRLGAPLAFGVRHVMPIVTDFVAAYPEVSIDLDLTDRRVNLVEEGIDLSVRITSQLDDTAVARKLSVCRSTVVASPEYLKKRGTPRHPDDLVKHECFGYTPAMRSMWPFMIDGALTWVPVRGRIQSNNGDALLEPVIRGRGIAYQPTFLTCDAVRTGKLKVILTRHPPAELGIYAIYPGNRYVPHRVRVLADFLAVRLGPEPAWDKRK